MALGVLRDLVGDRHRSMRDSTQPTFPSLVRTRLQSSMRDGFGFAAAR